MRVNQTDQQINWAELDATEVEKILRQQAGESGSAFSDFLDVHQWAGLSADIVNNGGYPDAQFRIATIGDTGNPVCFGRCKMDLPDAEIRTPAQFKKHLSRLGINDGLVGDVVVGSHIEYVYICSMNESGLNFHERVDSWNPPAVRPIKVNAASLRADAVVSALFKVSRSEAQTAIKYGFVWKNFEMLLKQSATITSGDQLVFRTKGRVRILNTGGTTKSGRIWLECENYPC